MTAEIAILNKEVVVLASDSAVTFRLKAQEKTSTSANKLFTLSKYYPVGIMFYGNALFMGIPWETIIKMYRNYLAHKKFATLKEYSKDFISFLNRANLHLTNESEDRYFSSFCFNCLDSILSDVEVTVNETHCEDEGLEQQQRAKISSQLVEELLDSWRKSKRKGVITFHQFMSFYTRQKDFVDKLIQDFIKFANMPAEYERKIKLLLYYGLAKIIIPNFSSGVVVAGFGENEIFPSLVSYEIEGIINNKVKSYMAHDIQISDGANAGVIAFAQDDMVTRFMEGIDPRYKDIAEGHLNELCNIYAEKVTAALNKYTDEEKQSIKNKLQAISEALMSDYKEKTAKIINERFIQPIIDTVAILPKNELTLMAESLVNLTSLKRKFSEDTESVAEPTDVMVISKGDGLVWINRKHYFKADMNPDFFLRREKELLDEYENKHKLSNKRPAV